MQVWRNDRHGRGGDHTEFLNAGYPAVRLSVAVENYDWQHQDLRTEKGKRIWRHHRQDGFPLSRQGDQAQRRRARRARQRAAAARAEGRGRGEHRYDAELGGGPGRRQATSCAGAGPMPTSGRSSCRRRRDCRSISRRTAIRPCSRHRHVLPGVRVDDWVFGVSSVSARTASKARSHPRCPAARSGRGWRRPPPNDCELATSRKNKCLAIRARTPACRPRKQILDFIAQSGTPAGKREIARAFGLSGHDKILLKAPAQGHGRRGADRLRPRPRLPQGGRGAQGDRARGDLGRGRAGAGDARKLARRHAARRGCG